MDGPHSNRIESKLFQTNIFGREGPELGVGLQAQGVGVGLISSVSGPVISKTVAALLPEVSKLENVMCTHATAFTF